MYRQRFKCERETVQCQQKGKMKPDVMKVTRYVLWTESLCPPPFHMLKPKLPM